MRNIRQIDRDESSPAAVDHALPQDGRQAASTVHLAVSIHRALQRLPLLVGVVMVLSFIYAGPALAAPSLAEMEKNLAREQERATSRQASLKRLTEQERRINSDLAAAEARILELESGIQAHQQKLLELAKEDEGIRQEYEELLIEQDRTEQAQAEALRLLWEISCKRQAVGNRDMADWAQVDREYTWSRVLYAVLEEYRATLDRQETRLTELLGRRDKLSSEIQQRLSQVNEEKNRLLQNRVAYERKLSELRQQRSDTEAELTEILRLVENLNISISKVALADISKLKGKMPWPVTGKLRQKYAPSANPPVRGVGFSTADNADVLAVAAGKVVHNSLLRGFGTVLILQHNDEYYSLYAYLGNSPLKVGDEVAGRQAVGKCGYYPAVSGSGLYFELRFKQKAINPEQWLAPAQGK